MNRSTEHGSARMEEEAQAEPCSALRPVQGNKSRALAACRFSPLRAKREKRRERRGLRHFPLPRIFHTLRAERRLAAGFPRSELAKPVTDRCSTLAPIPSECQTCRLALMPFGNSAEHFVPKGHPIIAQRFNAGLARSLPSSPAGTTEVGPRSGSLSSLRDSGIFEAPRPSVETLGYSHPVAAG